MPNDMLLVLFELCIAHNNDLGHRFEFIHPPLVIASYQMLIRLFLGFELFEPLTTISKLLLHSFELRYCMLVAEVAVDIVVELNYFFTVLLLLLPHHLLNHTQLLQVRLNLVSPLLHRRSLAGGLIRYL